MKTIKVLLQGIREVSQARPFFSPSIARRLKALEGNLTNGGAAKRKRANHLTPREEEVLKLIAEGYCNKQIADLLNVSIKTTEKHRQAMMNKLDIHETAGVTRYACERGFVAGVGNSPDQQPKLFPQL